MTRKRHFPPRGWITRKVFVGVIALLALGLLLAGAFGPIATMNDVDPRPWAAVISAVTYIGLIAMVAWLAWMALRSKRSGGRPDR